MSRNITIKQFNKEVLENIHLSVIYFKREWNGACQIIAPIYEELAKSYQDTVKFFIVDLDKEKQIAHGFGIIETPSILFFKNGSTIDYAVGLISKNLLILKIENALQYKN